MPTQLLSFFNHRIMEFMQRYDLPGVTVAVAKNEHLKLAAGLLLLNVYLSDFLSYPNFIDFMWTVLVTKLFICAVIA